MDTPTVEEYQNSYKKRALRAIKMLEPVINSICESSVANYTDDLSGLAKQLETLMKSATALNTNLHESVRLDELSIDESVAKSEIERLDEEIFGGGFISRPMEPQVRRNEPEQTKEPRVTAGQKFEDVDEGGVFEVVEVLGSQVVIWDTSKPRQARFCSKLQLSLFKKLIRVKALVPTNSDVIYEKNKNK